MSTSIHDIYDREWVSHCCGAKMYANIDMCSDCKEYCEAVTEEE